MQRCLLCRAAAPLLLLRAPFRRLHLPSAPLRVPRPRAQPSAPGVPDRQARLQAAAAALLCLLLGAPLAYLGLHGGLELPYLEERWAALTSVDHEDLLSALPDLATYAGAEAAAAAAAARGDGGGGEEEGEAQLAPSRAVARAGARLPLPAATLVLGWEGVCVDVVYDPKAGYVPVPRPGLAALLLACADAGIDTVLWSSAALSDSVKEQVARLVEARVAPLDAARYDAFQARVTDNYERARAVELAMATREGRRPAPMLPITPRDRTDLYLENVLRVPAVLGKEHCVAGGGGEGGGDAQQQQLLLRPLNLLCHARCARAALGGGCAAIDCVDASALGVPAHAGGGRAEAAGAEPSAPAPPPPPPIYYLRLPAWRSGEGDFCLFLMAELVREYAEWRRAPEGGGSAAGGSARGISEFLAGKQGALGGPGGAQVPWGAATRGILAGVARALREKMAREREGQGEGGSGGRLT